MSARFAFNADLWRHDGHAAWHFVTLPHDVSEQMRTLSAGLRNAFGSLRVIASIGKSTWRTSAFYDTKARAFVLPIKAEVRRKQNIGHGDAVRVSVEIDL